MFSLETFITFCPFIIILIKTYSNKSNMSEKSDSVSARVAKKVRRREEEPPDVDGESDDLMGERPSLFSFRGAVLNSSPKNTVDDDEWGMGDVKLQVEDVRKEITDGVPSIDFSDRVYALIDESMSKTSIVKLLGRRIDYNALWNKVCSLWKPMMRFQLMDIENDYYLAKF